MIFSTLKKKKLQKNKDFTTQLYYSFQCQYGFLVFNISHVSIRKDMWKQG